MCGVFEVMTYLVTLISVRGLSEMWKRAFKG